MSVSNIDYDYADVFLAELNNNINVNKYFEI